MGIATYEKNPLVCSRSYDQLSTPHFTIRRKNELFF